jgi:predicted RNA-binding Zn-ribbon protein involved in translation (DUF1610 family)
MASFNINCNLCGHTVSLGPKAVTVLPDERIYSFWCPTCGESVTKEADENIVQMLVEHGARVHENPPYPETIEDPSLPRITLDDVIDFGLELERRSV